MMLGGGHTETAFEKAITTHLVVNGGYWRAPGNTGPYDPDEALAIHFDYDRDRAIFPAHVLDFVATTQAKAWTKVGAILKGKRDALFLQELCKVMDKRGSLAVLRRGFTFYGKKFKLAYFRPGHCKNPDLWGLYEENRLLVVRQLRYDPNNDNELDLVLAVNGIPVLTCELKNAMTGQKAGNARHQFRKDRDPKAPIFRFKKRALVHFAVDADEAWMTTRLKKKGTYFLPFNRGHNHGAGNPPAQGKQRTHYLWEMIWERESLLDIIGRFIHVEKKKETDPNTGKERWKETMIFPRYHQLDCVRRLVSSSRANRAGTNYLVQHSAGSGKSNSIAWLAHRLSSLHDEQDEKVYHSVIVLTDRRVLDQQLQDTIYQIDHKNGVVEKINKHSDQLAQALSSGTPIIISTIHKFGFITDKIGQLPDRRYAIIVDEAHSSQSGEMAATVKELLADSTLDERVTEEAIEEELSTPDQLALRKALIRGPQPNMSFFAFTATPKYKTLEMFGHTGLDGKPAPFHLYSMRQAIEEKFILDVLRGYTTYERFFKLAKAIADDPELDKRKASRALARFVNLHPTNIRQKTEIIVEHFRSTVAGQLDGKAKAMVVTGSRLQAVKYKLSFDGYIQEKGYDFRCLVAFSGEVTDDKAPSVTYTEVGMNNGIKESELKDKFASDAYQVLLVANKYQTGFDQPLLCAMYVDKRLSGIQAVQTLSRLNRSAPGKQTTFVLDFVNEREEILAAFQDYYETTTTADEVDPQRLYELQHELGEAKVYTASEVDGFAAVFYRLPDKVTPGAHAKLNSWLDPAVDRFNALGNGEQERTELQEGFRGRLAAYRNLYGFLSQIVPFHDPNLEKLYAFGRMLLRKLPRPDGSDPLDLDDDVALVRKSLRFKITGKGHLKLAQDDGGALTGPGATGTGATKPPTERLSTIIDAINQRFGLNLPPHINEFLVGVSDALAHAEDVRLSAKANDKANFAHVFNPVLEGTMADHLEESTDFVTLFFKDEELRRFLSRRLLDDVYGRIREASAAEHTNVIPLAMVSPEQVRPFVNAVPVYDLKVAAGRFSAPQTVQEVAQQREVTSPAEFEWVTPGGRTKPAPGLFVAQVTGESMNRRIPDGAWCLWRLNPSGSRQGKIVLARHDSIADPDLGSYTVKRYESEKTATDDGMWRHTRVTLHPDSHNDGFEPIVLEGLTEGDLRIIAELVEVLSTGDGATGT